MGMVAGIASDPWRLLQVDSPRGRSQLYLRMLYSDVFSSEIRSLMDVPAVEIPATTRAVLQTVNFGLLSIEQAARKRNVLRHVLRAVPSLRVVLSEERLLAIAGEFVNSSDFWEARGRSLAENFCLFAYGVLSPSEGFERDVARLCGHVSGLSVAPQGLDPWRSRVVADSGPASEDALIEPEEPLIDGALVTESFLSSWRLVDDHGTLPSPENIEEVAAGEQSRIIVAVLPTRKVLVISLAV